MTKGSFGNTWNANGWVQKFKSSEAKGQTLTVEQTRWWSVNRNSSDIYRITKSVLQSEKRWFTPCCIPLTIVVCTVKYAHSFAASNKFLSFLMHFSCSISQHWCKSCRLQEMEVQDRCVSLGLCKFSQRNVCFPTVLHCVCQWKTVFSDVIILCFLNILCFILIQVYKCYVIFIYSLYFFP